METREKPQFLQLLTRTMAAYGKPLPETGIVDAWVLEMTPFPLQVIEQGMAAYRDLNGQFSPVPAAITKICRVMDGRPSDEEAWAMSFPACSEQETVVWTEEMREAFLKCKPLLDICDNVGARMAFKALYNRLVDDARRDMRAPRWEVSPGRDRQKREFAIKRAEDLGRLPPPEPDESDVPRLASPGRGEDSCPEGLKRVKELVATLVPMSERVDKLRHERLLAERADSEAKKAQIVEQYKGYGKGSKL
jgi:hypothetical protein